MPALDAVRGLAILLVLVGHSDLDAPWAASATVGVGIFFALSGYLITGLLVAEKQRTGRVSVTAFYLRRARRLLPALGVFVAAMLTLGLATPSQAVPVAFYFADVAKSAGAPLGPFAATWSLAVEEQFYLVWPAILLLVWRRPVLLTAFLAALSLAAGLPWAAGLLGGCLAALVGITPSRSVTAAAAGILAIMAFAVPTTLGHSVIALAAPFLVAGTAGTHVRLPALEWTGRISYAMYLWHYPVALALWTTPLPWIARFGILAIAGYGFAAISWVVVERRFLRGRDRDRVLTGVGVPGREGDHEARGHGEGHGIGPNGYPGSLLEEARGVPANP